jgi:hypothetical protein
MCVSYPAIMILNGPKGRLDEALLIAAEVKDRRLDTVVLGRRCTAACAIMFLAGTHKFAGIDTQIGWSTPPTVYVAEGVARLISAHAMLQWLGVPEDISSRSTSRDNGRTYYLNAADRAKLGVATVGQEGGVSSTGTSPAQVRAKKRLRTERKRHVALKPSDPAASSVDPVEQSGSTFLAVPEEMPVHLLSYESVRPVDQWFWEESVAGAGYLTGLSR